MSENCKLVHEILEQFPKVKYPFDMKKLPKNGIYFFYENTELWGHNESNNSRIVRVGTHRANDNFRSRIRNHYGKNLRVNHENISANMHNSSIFRKNIGMAILNQEKNNYLEIWNKCEPKSNRSITFEKKIEARVTELLRMNFSFRFIIFKDKSMRMYFESKLIGILAQCSLCNPSSTWFGRHSPKKEIQSSGLWQTQHLRSDELNAKDTDELLECISITKKWIEKHT